MRMFERQLRNENGVGIVLVLVLCAAIGAVALYVMNISKDSEKKITDDARVLSYKFLVNSVKNHLHNGPSCSRVLKDLNITNAFNPNGMSIELDLKLPANRKVLRRPNPANPKDVWYLAGGTSVRDVLLFVNERVFSPVILDAPGATPLVAAKGYILIIPGHAGVGVHLARNRGYRIPIFLYYSVSGGTRTLHSCFDPSGDASICTATGGAYDYTREGMEKCQPQIRCISQRNGIVADPNVCVLPFRPLLLGNIAGSNRYICEWCNVNPICRPSYYLGRGRFYTPKTKENGVQDEPLQFLALPLVDPNQVSNGLCF